MAGTQVNQGSLGIGHRTQLGPPFPGNSAENGLSVAANGRIVLGGDLGTPAPLLNDREIDLATFLFTISEQGFPLFDISGASISARMGDIAGLDGGSHIDTVNLNPDARITATGMTGRMLNLDWTTNIAEFGIIDAGAGTQVNYQALGGSALARIGGNGQLLLELDILNLVTQLGDILAGGNQSIETITDATSTHDFSNGAGTAIYSINGNPGISGTFAPPLSITVEGGIITAAT